MGMFLLPWVVQYSRKVCLKTWTSLSFLFFQGQCDSPLKITQVLAVLQFINKTLKHIFTVVQVQAQPSSIQAWSLSIWLSAWCNGGANVFRDPKQCSNVYKRSCPFIQTAFSNNLVLQWRCMRLYPHTANSNRGSTNSKLSISWGCISQYTGVCVGRNAGLHHLGR